MKKGFFVFLFAVTCLFAQKQDSVKTYNLEDILVQSGVVIEPEKIINIDAKKLDKIDASNISEITRLIPSLKLQNNSQGQSLVYLRGAGKRQLLLMFEGSQLNIPWDYRIDLSMVPTEAIGAVSVTKGIPSVIFGVNNMAGVISINTKKYKNRSEGKINISGGTGSFKKTSGYWLGGSENLSYLVSAGYNERDGFRLPSDFDREDGLRTNTQSKNFNTFAKVDYRYSTKSDLAFSVSYINAEKGVPAEFDVAKKRFWQYPVWDKLSANLTGSHSFSNTGISSITYAFSASKFDLEIDQFTDETYSVLDEKEINEDYVYTGRLIYTQLINNNSILKLSFNGYNTSHKEVNKDGNLAFMSEANYSQNIYSLGFEYEYILDKFSFLAGISYDGVNTPDYKDNPIKSDETDYSFTSTVSYKINSNLIAQGNFGRKTRFPSLREALSDGNGKYIINYDLTSEIAHTTDLGISYLGNKFSVEGSFFLTYLKDGIIRKALPDKQYIRINKDKIRTYGLELKAALQFSKKFRTDISFTTLSSLGENANGNFEDKLEYKPEVMASLSFDYSPFQNINFLFDINYVGEEYGYQEGNEEIQKLPDYILFNIRTGYTFHVGKTAIDSYVRINNLTDKLYYTQWGLPETGREIRAGLSFDL